MRNTIEIILIIIAMIISFFLAIDIQITKDINANKQYEQQLEECFMQEPRTKDCEFVLWKHENR